MSASADESSDPATKQDFLDMERLPQLRKSQFCLLAYRVMIFFRPVPVNPLHLLSK
jgi:hypothetical protein